MSPSISTHVSSPHHSEMSWPLVIAVSGHLLFTSAASPGASCIRRPPTERPPSPAGQYPLSFWTFQPCSAQLTCPSSTLFPLDICDMLQWPSPTSLGTSSQSYLLVLLPSLDLSVWDRPRLKPEHWSILGPCCAPQSYRVTTLVQGEVAGAAEMERKEQIFADD